MCKFEPSFGFKEGPVDLSVSGRGASAEPHKQNSKSIRAADDATSLIREQGRPELFT
jgi:hypothetical protein